MHRPAKRRVVILIDANTGEVLECPEDIEVFFIPWTQINEEYYQYPEWIEELDTALEEDLDKAIEISRAMTEDADDGGEDPKAVFGGYG